MKKTGHGFFSSIVCVIACCLYYACGSLDSGTTGKYTIAMRTANKVRHSTLIYSLASLEPQGNRLMGGSWNRSYPWKNSIFKGS